MNAPGMRASASACAGPSACRGDVMRFTKSVAAAAALAVAAFSFTSFSAEPARANANDAIIAGAAGFAVGTLFGNATARPLRGAAGHLCPAAAARLCRARACLLRAGSVDT